MTITSKGHDGVYRLVYEKSGAEVVPGDRWTGRDGRSWSIIGGRAPHKPGSTGRAHVQSVDNDGDFLMEYFPSVVGAVWEHMPTGSAK